MPGCLLVDEHERTAHRTQAVLGHDLRGGGLLAQLLGQRPRRQVVALADGRSEDEDARHGPGEPTSSSGRRPGRSLMRGCNGRPVRRDVRVAEVAVRHAGAGEQLRVARQELVDAAVERHCALPAAAQLEPFADQVARALGSRRTDDEVVARNGRRRASAARTGTRLLPARRRRTARRRTAGEAAPCRNGSARSHESSSTSRTECTRSATRWSRMFAGCP